MNKLFSLIVILAILSGCQKPTTTYDIVVYGGTSAGVIAAVSVAKLGKTVVLIEPTEHLGGMSASGLGSTDIGNKYAVQGLARKFYRDLGSHYGNFENWTFEPKIAEETFNRYIEEEKIKVFFSKRIVGVNKVHGKIQFLALEESKDGSASRANIKGKQFIDCTYEGDLMAKAGVSYFVGREANSKYNETINGVQLRKKHQFPDGIDPYVVKGDPSSGLLPGINPTVQPNGTGDKRVQAYNYRLCLTNKASNRIAFPEPDNYDPINYELLWRVMQKNLGLDDQGNPLPGVDGPKYDNSWQWKSFKTGFIIQYMPEEKTDFNHLGGFSIDYIGQNHDYPEATYARRSEIFEEHRQFILGIFHFLQTDPRVPEAIRTEAHEWGLPKDEFPDNGGWPYYLYVRETRRMLGEYIMTEHNCVGDEVVEDGIALAAYTMDSHNCQRVVVDGMVKNEGNVEVGGFGPYPISYRSLVPKRGECTNLLVPVCLSASHIAYGSIRMEPVFMVLGQISAHAASLAIDEDKDVQSVNAEVLAQRLATDPYLDGSKADITLDDASSNVEFSGDVVRKQAFMVANDTSYLAVDKAVANSYIKFPVKAEGKYEARFFVTKLRNKNFVLPDSVKVEVSIDEKPIQKSIAVASYRGKTVSMGEFEFSGKDSDEILIKAMGEGEALIGDAILLIPVK